MNPSTHADVENNDEGDGDRIDVYSHDDGERLIKPRNNFASYANEGVDVRFRVNYLITRYKELCLVFPVVFSAWL